MRRWAIIIVALMLGCSSETPTRNTPKGAFTRLARCVDTADEKCLFDELDRNSRWSLHSIYRTIRQARALVEKSYPEDRKDEALGSWKAESKANDVYSMFDIFCKKRNCLKDLTEGFGAILQIEEKSSGEVIVTTTRNKAFTLRSFDGEWGLATYGKDLEIEKIRLADNLAEIQKNAAAFDEQRLATGEK